MLPKNNTPSRDLPWREIRARLIARGVAISDLAAGLGISRQAVSKVARSSSRTVQAAIARELGLHPAQIWPSRYPSGDR